MSGGRVWIGDDASADGDERGTFLHVVTVPAGTVSRVPDGAVYVRMGNDLGRHLNAEEATSLRDALNDFLEAAK